MPTLQAVVRVFRRPRVLGLAVPVVVLLVVAASLLAFQRPSAGASTVLTLFRGTTSVAHGPADFVTATDGEILANGDRVRTDADGHALVTFFDGSTLEVEPATEMRIDMAAASGNGPITIQLTQTIGRTWASVQKLAHGDSKFEVHTPTSTAAVRGTAFLTEVLPDGETRVETTDGTVAVSAQGQTVLVTQGLATTVRTSTPPTAPVPMRTPNNTLRFGMHSPAYLLILDPIGRSCGIAMPGAKLVRQIPGCAASEPGVEPQLVDVPNAAPGTYRAVIAAIEPGGAFTFTATGLDDRGGITFDRSVIGNGVPGAVFGSALDVQTGPDGRLDASTLGSLVTLQGPSPSPSATAVPTDAARPTTSATPSETATVPPSTPRTSLVPVFQLPTLPTASPTQAPTIAPTASPTPTLTFTPTPTPAATPVITPSPTPVGTTPIPGCVPSSAQPNKCDPPSPKR